MPLTTGTALEAVADPAMFPVVGDILDEIQYRWQAQALKWGPWQDRADEITALNRGEWDRVWPGEFDEEPSVANIFRGTIEDGGRLFAELDPMIRVDPEGISDRAARKAERRERILHAYLNRSGILNRGTKELLGMDFIAAGLEAIRVWPDLGVPANRRFPRYRRIDPRFVLPDIHFAPDIPTDNVVVAWKDSPEMIRMNFPVAFHDMLASTKGNETDFEWFSVEFYSSRYCARAVYAKARSVFLSTQRFGFDWQGRRIRATLNDADRPSDMGRLVAYVDNPTDICPVQLGVRPNWSQEPLGMLDDSKGKVLTKNRYFRLLLDYFIRMVYGGKLAWNIDNPHDSGADTVYRALSADARMDPVTPQQSAFQAWEVLDRLDDESRTDQIAPKAREGEADVYKATAAFLQGAQGKLRSVIRSHQEVHAQTMEYANEAAFAQDEAWCNAEKEITGRARGQRFKDKYVPKRDIDGEHGNRVQYGSRGGMDAATYQIQVLQQLGQGLLDEEEAMEKLGEVDDVKGTRQRRFKQQVENGVYGVLADPTAPVEQFLPGIKMRLGVLKALQKPNATVENVIEEAEAALAPPPAAALPPGAPPGMPPIPGAVPSGLPAGVPSEQAPAGMPPIEELVAAFGEGA